VGWREWIVRMALYGQQMEQLLNSFRRLNHDTLRWESIVSRYDSRPLLTNLMIRITNAATSSKWISPPETIFSEKPRIHKMISTAIIVQSILLTLLFTYLAPFQHYL